MHPAVGNGDLHGIRRAQRADGPATVLAIGTAVPPNVMDQTRFPDYYLRITNNQDNSQLREKIKRICAKSGVTKRHLHLTEELLNDNPSFTVYKAPSLDARQDIWAKEVPLLGKDAAVKALEEWGQHKSKITHLLFCSSVGTNIPDDDHKVAKLLGLSPTVSRFVLHNLGCFSGATTLRVAKDIAENNKGSRVLVICSETILTTFRGHHEDHADNLVGQILFGDGAGAVIIGADPILEIENPMFELVWGGQCTLPDTDTAIYGGLREAGLIFHLAREVPSIISKNIEECLVRAFEPLGISDWNSLFYITHPGGPEILDQIEQKLRLEPKKLVATRKVLSEYGNMSSTTILFIMDEMRKMSVKDEKATTGEGFEWGVLFGFGPGLTIETLALRSLPIPAIKN